MILFYKRQNVDDCILYLIQAVYLGNCLVEWELKGNRNLARKLGTNLLLNKT